MKSPEKNLQTLEDCEGEEEFKEFYKSFIDPSLGYSTVQAKQGIKTF